MPVIMMQVQTKLWSYCWERKGWELGIEAGVVEGQKKRGEVWRKKGKEWTYFLSFVNLCWRSNSAIRSRPKEPPNKRPLW